MIDAEVIMTLVTLTLLEVVLGIDNIIFIALLVQKLPLKIARKARLTGLTLALGMRILFLLTISWIISLTHPLITIFNYGFSGRDLMFLGGGLFLMFKVGKEIWEEFTSEAGEKQVNFKGGFVTAIIQIIIIDLIFSFDSVITAVGLAGDMSAVMFSFGSVVLTKGILIIIVAMTIAMVAMLFTSGWIAEFIRKNPSIKMLALAFIFLIGIYLVTEAFEVPFDKGYIYFSMGFALIVELLNMAHRKKIYGHKKNKASH